MADNIALVDAETLAALKVLRGDNKKDANAVDKEFTSGLAQQIVEALSAQKETSSNQTSELIEAVREQTAVLQKLTDLLETKQKTTVVVVDEDDEKEKSPSVASTAADSEHDNVAETGNIDGDDDDIAAAVATTVEAAPKAEDEAEEVAEETTTLAVAKTTVEAAPETEETAKEVAEETTPPAVAVAVAPEQEAPALEKQPVASAETDGAAGPSVVRGSWTFVESDVALERRSRVSKTNTSFRYLQKGEEIPKEAFAPITNAQILKKGDALFGNVSGDEQLIGDSFGNHWVRMRSLTSYGKLKAPLWSTTAKKSVRSLLPKLAIGGKTTIALESGVYYLTVKYEEEESERKVEAAIIIGEISFDNTGSVIAPGAKLLKLLDGEKQKETASSKNKWYTARVSEGWKNGDFLRFKIDTNTNTVVYTLTAYGAKEAKAGWRFENVLAFTSLPIYKRDIRAFAYCGGKGRIAGSAVKLTIVDETPGRDGTETEATATADILAETDADPVPAGVAS
eukprot:CAMPEP_0197191918 /NCGR_PEP_ID=MMETSP1423-20130617/24245_1 /TAXON_ID=476441 /ORGANISM="Pseudo-nitzschia heimii, Strain UNC1101" /LENGTH=510 /DNA_ID=CAMNT_0042644703 /DNA_START=133 /DNA_END=1665 /DNA_ORIENTATION=-